MIEAVPYILFLNAINIFVVVYIFFIYATLFIILILNTLNI